MTERDKQPLDDLFQMQEESLEKILVNLLDDENVGMKTEIQRPTVTTKLEFLGVWLDVEGATDSSEMVEKFVKLFKVNMVSHKRQSRKEIIQGLSAGFQEERSVGDKLTKPVTKE
jgi:hypothetical protein